MRLIDADALIDEVMERYCKGCDKRKGIKDGKYRIIYNIGDAPCRACAIDDMKAELEDATTIEPHWIPCKERLPEVGEYVLTCISGFEDGCMGIDFLEKHIGGLHWMNDHGDLTDLEAITAWMPMPKPYKEEEE